LRLLRFVVPLWGCPRGVPLVLLPVWLAFPVVVPRWFVLLVGVLPKVAAQQPVPGAPLAPAPSLTLTLGQAIQPGHHRLGELLA
jgi:hypothetical protein